MIIVTGGAGFIGSSIVTALNMRGIKDVIIVDTIRESTKWRNIIDLDFIRVLDKNDFIKMLEGDKYANSISAIFHLGACSDTTQSDKKYLFENNYQYTKRLAIWHEKHLECRFIYASSAATYGDGSNGFSDNIDLGKLKPLNWYAYFKHAFDVLANKEGWLSNIVGLKYFNVFGDGENHKGEMRSFINKKYHEINDYGIATLFMSNQADIKDGDQKRDFIYIDNAVAMTMFFFDNPKINGIFNIGTSKAVTFNHVAESLFTVMKKPKNIKYIPIPGNIKGYQSYTCADISKIRAAGYKSKCSDVKVSIRDYVDNYLKRG